MTLLEKAPLVSAVRARNVTAVLGPTNTGKTHLAIERLLGHESGAIGLPLRLLAREVYGRIAARAGAGQVALVTGEEKVIPPRPRYWVSTVEAMPRDLDVSFVAIDEVQLAGDLERGHVFTDRILNVRGSHETLLLGSATARPLVERLLPGVHVITRPRLSQLAYAGQKKITRLPRRSAVVAFSAEEVYAVAELIRRQRGGAAVVMGALSPRTRNAQVALFQNGDVEFLVATDAIGMGLNLDVDHVAFAQARKFDGYQYRNLTPAEMGQIAGRAGRYLNDGSFGVTGQVGPFEDDLVRAIESHDFEPVKTFQWRNAALDFASVERLRASLDAVPAVDGLTRALPSDDIRALDYALRDAAVEDRATTLARVRLLWEVCQVPDFRKISPAQHGDLVVALYRYLAADGRLPDDWFARQVAFCDRADGDIDALSRRLADIRTWTFVANRSEWLGDPVHWQERTRDIEDRLSDALHERLTQRFVDRRTSVLMKRLRENAMLEAEITGTGAVLVEGQHVGELHGFRFVPDPSTSADTPDGRAVRTAAAKALAGEFEKRAERISKAPNDDFVLSSDYALRWLGQPVAKVVAGEDALGPRVTLTADEQLTGPARDKVQARLDLWMYAHIATLLKPLVDLRNAADLEGIARGVAFRLVEALGTLERQEVAEDVKALDQTARAALRKYGVRFGAYHIYVPALLKPAPATLVAQLWALKSGATDIPGLAELPQLSASGRTSIKVDPAIDRTLYRLVGFRVAGERAVRLDILERLADIIRPLIAWKPAGEAAPPEGAVPQGGGFTVTVAMTSLLGCSGEDFNSILKALGYRVEKRTLRVPVKTGAAASGSAIPAEPAAPVEPEAPVEPAAPAEQASVDPAVPVEPEAPAEPAETVEPEAPAEPAETVEPAQTLDPAETVEPAQTVDPAETVEPAAPAEQASVDPAVPVEPEAPVEPAEPDGIADVGARAPASTDQPDDAQLALVPEAAATDAEGTAGIPHAEATGGDRPHAADDAGSSPAVDDVHATPAAQGAEQPGTGMSHSPAATGLVYEEREVEVWRPGRPDRGRRPDQRSGPQNRPARQGDARQGHGGGPPSGERQGRFEPRRPQGPRPDRPDRPDDRRPRPEAQGDRRPPPQGDRPPRRDKPVDPNSPFAALLALKADLEQKQKKK